MKRISIISPVFENVNRLNQTITGLIDFFKDKYEFEVFYYHSVDLPQNTVQDSRFIFTKTDKKQSHDDCVTDGFERATGDCVIVADLNDVEYKDYLLRLIVEWENNAQIVLVKKDETKLNFFQKIGKFFKGIGHKIQDLFMSFAGLSKDFRALRTFQLFARNVVEVIKEFPEKNYYLRNFDCWVDFRVSVLKTTSKIKVKRKQKFMNSDFACFLASTLLFVALLLTVIFVVNKIPDANRSMFVVIGIGLMVAFALFGNYNFFQWTIYRLSNIRNIKKSKK